VICSSGNPTVDPHEVGILSEFGDEVSCTMPLNGSSYPVDGHETLLRSGVAHICNFVRGLVEIADG
jgi:hypothetical protein